jgi:hypothetical protein
MNFFLPLVNPRDLLFILTNKDYEISVDPKIIKKAESLRFYGRKNEFPLDHMTALHELSALFGKDEIQQRYYFFEIVPFHSRRRC